MTAARSTLRHVRSSPLKLREVAAGLVGLPAGEALNRLEFQRRKGARILKKVLEAALANAEHNDHADVDLLEVTNVRIDQGRSMKRLRARARGRADRIHKRTSHVTVMVGESE